MARANPQIQMTDTALPASYVMPHLRLSAAEPWLYLAPALAVLVVWTYLPLLQAFELSFYQWNMLPRAQPLLCRSRQLRQSS